jgi:hypothetical protein
MINDGWDISLQHIRNPSRGENTAASSAQAPVETAGPVSSLGLARGSLPVSSADFLELAARWEYVASLCTRGDYFSVEQTGKRMLMACAFDLRRQVALSTERQPEENTEGETRRPSAPHSP